MQKMRISKITLHDAASRKLYRTSVLLHLKKRESLALPFDYFIISNFNSINEQITKVAQKAAIFVCCTKIFLALITQMFLA